MSKKTFIEFLTEKRKKANADDEKFKDVDCESDDLSEEEMEYCAGNKLVKYLYKAQQSQ